MAASATKTVNILLSQHTLHFVENTTNVDLMCIMCKKLKVDVLQTYCACIYCCECIYAYLSDGEKYCLGRKEECKEEHLVLEKNVFRNAMLDRKIMRAKVRCPNVSCLSVTELYQLNDHLRLCSEQRTWCPYTNIGCELDGASINEIKVHIHEEESTHARLLIDLMQNFRNELNILKEIVTNSHSEITCLKAQVYDQQREMTELRKEVQLLKDDSRMKENAEDIDRIVNADRAKVDNLTRIIEGINIGTNTKVAVGLTSFTVGSFSDRVKANDEVLSPFFYSHTNGYKLQLQVYPGGRRETKGKYLSVFYGICKGEYDDILAWPCRYSFKISIIDQCSGDPYKSEIFDYSTVADNIKVSFCKPVSEDNVAFGCPSFMSHMDLRSVVSLFGRDSVTFQCQISAPK